jgi:hypothetical protein
MEKKECQDKFEEGTTTLTECELARAERYREYLLGWAYIPLTDLPKYESAYKKTCKEKRHFA